MSRARKYGYIDKTGKKAILGEFTDVLAGAYYAKPVEWAVGRNITKGSSWNVMMN